MKKILITLSLVCLSCNNEKIIQLPEIVNAEITEVNDVSPAYIFYDEAQADSTLLNRKNLISTTNWLVNVDKRLRLDQVINDIVFLQDKKRNAKMHKNENARNFYTCNDTSIKNLGFIDFTEVYYKLLTGEDHFENEDMTIDKWILTCYADNSYSIKYPNDHFVVAIDPNETKTSLELLNDIITVEKSNQLLLQFEDSMSFQHYITIKNTLDQLLDHELNIVNEEYLFH